MYTYMCVQASKLEGLTDPNHVWMYIAWYPQDWWSDPEKNTSCTREEVSLSYM